MAKPIGAPKTGGRKKGTLNKRTVAFSDLLELKKMDLLGEILRTAENLEGKDKAGIYVHLLPYVYPKRKPVDIPFTFNEHLDLLAPEQLHLLHAEVEQKLGLLPRSSDTPCTQKEFEDQVARAMQEIEDEV